MQLIYEALFGFIYIILLVKGIVNVFFNDSSLKKSFKNWQENAGIYPI